MVETAEQMGVLLTVGHQSRFSPAGSGPLPPTAGRRLRLPLLCPGQHGPADGNPHLGALFRPSSPGWRMSDRSGHSRSGSGSVVAERFFPGLLLRRHLSRPGRLPYSRQPLGHLGPRHAPDGDRCLWTGCAAKRHGAESGYQLGPSRAGRPGRDRYALRQQPPGRSSFPAAIQSAAHRAPAWSLPAIRCRRRSRAQIGRNWRIFYLPSGSIGCLW